MILAVDLGDARTGVCVSDLSHTIAGRAEVLTSRGKALVLQIAALADECGAARIVIGNPLNMDGSRGERSEKSRRFAQSLRSKTSCQVVLWDERLTTVEALRVLHDNKKKLGGKHKGIDAVAASLILQNYLDFLKNSETPI